MESTFFIAMYIRQRESEGDMDFGWKRGRDLKEEIRREENHDTRR